MAGLEVFRSWFRQKAVLPPVTQAIALVEHPKEVESIAAPAPSSNAEPISAFLCIIEYDGENRLISCRRYDGVNEHRYVGAICHQAGGYRQFRCDRITTVYDAQSGEILGDGGYFARYALDGYREKAPTWGLQATQKGRLVAGLNVLAFMARCDGRWHNLESAVIEQFVATLWLRMEWPGEPDIAAIVAHTERLAPDGDALFRALKYYAESDKMRQVLRRSIGELIAADGRICPAEVNWAAEIDGFFRDYDEAGYKEYLDTWSA